MMSKKLIKNGVVITADKKSFLGYVLLEKEQIIEVGKGDIEVSEAEVINAEGNYISPGFIDIHLHGGGDADFMDGNQQAYIKAAEMHAKHGTTLMYPTTLTSTNESLYDTFEVFKDAQKAITNGATLGGLHIEGPYFAYEQRGAQDPRYLRNPEPKEYLEILSKSQDIARWSLAPELPGAYVFAKELDNRGIQVSMAHTNATFEEAVRACNSGFSSITHFYSCMSTITRRKAYRYAGVVECGYYLDDLYLEIIADGIHVPQSLLKLIFKIKGTDKIILVTDAMRAAGMGEGKSILGSLSDGQEIIVEDGVAKLLDKSSFAGSVATADRLIRTVHQLAELPIEECVYMMTVTPAKLMNIQHYKGKLEKGYDADILIFDKDVDVKMTIIKGRIVTTK
ncbi:N-acetylglucosamine 6-phosphate deacetylase [Bacteroides zoogleoformans]|nr:N-acetylglucosamine 6-phosphate deacetylase [Bacteroides zoogleoformans]